MIRNNQIR